MSELGPEETARLEALVRGHLERQAETVDPRPLFARIQASVAPIARRRRAWRWAAYAAAAVLLAVMFVPRGQTALASGATLVREARQAHRTPVDRCYLVEVRRDSAQFNDVLPASAQVRMTRLWARGDRFWVESVRPEQRWAWGRDEANRFWIGLGRLTAVRLDADEVPYWLNVHCDLHSLNFEKWLGEVLFHFDLTREPQSAEADASTVVVRAKARVVDPRYPAVDSAELDIDAETRVVRRMVVRRVLGGKPFVTITYTLTETDVLDPADYRLEGHLAEGAEIYTRDYKPERRKELLARWFGPRPGRPFRLPEIVK